MHYYAIPGVKNREEISYYAARGHMQPDEIIDIVSEFYSVPVDQIKRSGGRGRKKVVHARQVCAYLLCQYVGSHRSLREIGMMLGGLDHSSATYARQRIEGLIEVDKCVAAEILLIKNSLY